MEKLKVDEKNIGLGHHRILGLRVQRESYDDIDVYAICIIDEYALFIQIYCTTDVYDNS